MHSGQVGSHRSGERLWNPVTILNGSPVTVSPMRMTSPNVLTAVLRPASLIPIARINRKAPASRASLGCFVAASFVAPPPHPQALSQPTELFLPTLILPA